MRRTWTERLTSRPFLLTVGAVLTAVGTAVSGETTWFESLAAIVTAVGIFTGGESYRDGQAAK